MLGQEDRRPGPRDVELSPAWQKGARPKLCTAGWDLKSSIQGERRRTFLLSNLPHFPSSLFTVLEFPQLILTAAGWAVMSVRGGKAQKPGEASDVTLGVTLSDSEDTMGSP